MKVLFLTLLCSLVAVQVSSDVEPVVYQAVSAAEEALAQTEKLWLALELPECYSALNAAEAKMKSELGRLLKEAVGKIVDGWKFRVQNTKTLVGIVKDKVDELKQKLLELGKNATSKSKEAIELVKAKVRNLVDTILEHIRSTKGNFDHQMDEVSKISMKELLEQLRETIIAKVRDIREHVEKIAVDNEAVQKLKGLLTQISDSELSHILEGFLDFGASELKNLKAVYKKLVELYGKADEVFKKKIYDLTAWISTMFRSSVGEVCERYQHIKTALFEMVSKGKADSIEAFNVILNDLEKYKGILGTLYHELVHSLKEAVGGF